MNLTVKYEVSYVTAKLSSSGSITLKNCLTNWSNCRVYERIKLSSLTSESNRLYSANDKSSTRILMRIKGLYVVPHLWGNDTLKFGIKGVEMCQITIVKGSSKRHIRNVF